MNSVNRDFKGIWIPKELYLNDKINWTEKILLIEIDSLDNEKGCFASNEYFANFVGKSKRYVSRIIGKLKRLGYICQEDFDGRHRILRSKMHFKLKPAMNTDNKQSGTKVPGGGEQKFHHNNTSNNKNKSSSGDPRKNISSKKDKSNDNDVMSKDIKKTEAIKLLQSQGIHKTVAKRISKHKTLKLIKHIINKVKNKGNIKNYSAYLARTLQDDPREDLPVNSPKTPNKDSNKRERKNKLNKVDLFLRNISGRERNKREKKFLNYLKDRKNDRNGVYLKQYKEQLKNKLPAPEEIDSNIKFLIYDCFLKEEKQTPNKLPQYKILKWV